MEVSYERLPQDFKLTPPQLELPNSISLPFSSDCIVLSLTTDPAFDISE